MRKFVTQELENERIIDKMPTTKLAGLRSVLVHQPYSSSLCSIEKHKVCCSIVGCSTLPVGKNISYPLIILCEAVSLLLTA